MLTYFPCCNYCGLFTDWFTLSALILDKQYQMQSWFLNIGSNDGLVLSGMKLSVAKIIIFTDLSFYIDDIS